MLTLINDNTIFQRFAPTFKHLRDESNALMVIREQALAAGSAKKALASGSPTLYKTSSVIEDYYYTTILLLL